MKVVITGAAGFVGDAVRRELESRGHEVVGLDIAADETRGIHRADVSEPGAGAEHFAGADAVVHTAALVSYAMTHEDAFAVNVEGTQNILDTARNAGVRRFVHVSSVVVYPDVPRMLDEDSPIDVSGVPYMDTKVVSEIPVYRAMIAGDLECSIVRPGDIYGPRSRPWTALPYEAMKKKQFVLPKMGKGHFTPVFIDDLARGIAAAVESPNAPGEVFNITDGTVVTCKEFFTLLARHAGTGWFPSLPSRLALGLATALDRIERLRGRRTESNPTTIRYFMRETGGYGIGKARKLLGYEPQVGLEEGQRRAGEWCRRQG
ncbi:NAD-dependent epimerase/dehydratase family protein [Corynebacterium hansenii]|uniref:NAD-dependent epimerase/dehydratase family protein n=1 Tax=Corynebacterium hansenii TaxID=394964 RepID=A0ABV7ZKT7_9CORY|nr:NAD(P)-dependent oxidoreductase [Corynebacterium hansenii]WJY99411.1 UDP-glucose 4-epimerase [Corynebacterium hansenii]